MDKTTEHNAAAQKLALSVDKLNLSSHTRLTLKAAGIDTVRDILETENDRGLLRVRNIGKVHKLEIQNALAKVGLDLYGGEVYDAPSPEPSMPEPDAPQPQEIQADVVPAPLTEQAEPPGHPASPIDLPLVGVAPVAEPERALPSVMPAPVQLVPSPQPMAPLLKTVAFVDYEHWYVSLKERHRRRPNISAWFSDLKTRGRLLEVTFFGDFSDTGGMKDEIATIRMYTNRIIETKNPSEYSKKDFTDFIMLDNIYQKIITMPDIEQVVLFTGDGHFSSVAAYLRNFCSKVVGVYGVDRAISGQLEAISDWCVRIPFVNEPYMECRAAILKNLKYAEEHTKSPTFQATVRFAAEHYDLPEDAVEAELRLMIDEGVVYAVSERSRWDYKVMLNILKVNWNLAGQPDT